MTRTDDITYRIGANATRFQQGMSSAERIAKRTFAVIGRLGVGLSVGLTGLVAASQQAASALAEIGDEARRAGLDVRTFQELKYVAEQNRIGVDSLVDGIKELNLRADEFITTGAGSSAEAFARLGYDAETLADKLADPSALFSEILGKLQQFDEAAQIRIADEIFGGTGGEKFVQLIAQGEAGIQATIQAAHDLGNVLSEDVISKANDLDQAFSAVTNTVGNGLKTAIVNASWAMYDFLQQFWEMENRTTASLDNSLTELGLKRVRLENDILRLESESRSNSQAGDFSGAVISGMNTGEIARIRAEMEDLVVEERRILEALGNRTPPSAPGSGGLGQRTIFTEEIKEEKDTVRDLIDALQNELQMLGRSELEQRINAELRKVGAEATADQSSEIRALVTNIENEREAMEKLETAMENAQGMAKDFLSGLIGDMKNGVSGAQSLANAFGRLGDRLLDMALDQAISGLFDNLMGSFNPFGPMGGLPVPLIPGNATGTNNWRGGLTSVNERGGEILNLPRGTQIIPHDVSMQMARSGEGNGSSVHLSMPVSIEVNDVNDAQAAANAAVDALAARIPSVVKRVMADPHNMSRA